MCRCHIHLVALLSLLQYRSKTFHCESLLTSCVKKLALHTVTLCVDFYTKFCSYSLFHHTVDCKASTVWWMVKIWIKNNVEGGSNGLIKVLSQLLLEILCKTTQNKNLSNSRCPSQTSGLAPREYKYSELPIHQPAQCTSL
jgi:hypothetical protein